MPVSMYFDNHFLCTSKGGVINGKTGKAADFPKFSGTSVS